MREYDEWGEPRLRCPDCGGALNMVFVSGRKRWYCPVAIGEQAFDRERRWRYIPEPSEHKLVIEWHASDPQIAKQLFEYGPSSVLTGGEAREAVA